MSTEIIGVKQLQHNIKHYGEAALAGRTFVVVRNSKPFFKIVPASDPVKTGTWKSMVAAAQFDGDPDLSARIDEVVYGNTR